MEKVMEVTDGKKMNIAMIIDETRLVLASV